MTTVDVSASKAVVKPGGVHELMEASDRSSDTKMQGRAIMIVIAIVALVFINAGIFYTTQIAKETNKAIGSTDQQKVSTTKLDTTNLERLNGRVSVDVEPQLAPYASGRANPFVSP